MNLISFILDLQNYLSVDYGSYVSAEEMYRKIRDEYLDESSQKCLSVLENIKNNGINNKTKNGKIIFPSL